MTARWSTGLCDCFASEMCPRATFCGCCVYGLIVDNMTPNEVCCGGDFCAACHGFLALQCCTVVSDCIGYAIGLPPVGAIAVPASVCLHCPARAALRSKYGIQGSPCEDCVTVWCCPCCALVQEYEELRSQARSSNTMYSPVPAVDSGII